MKRLIYALLAALALWSTPSPAQQPITLPANTLYGRLGVGPGPGQAIPFATVSPLIGAVVGPGSSTVGRPAVWGNTTGTQLLDGTGGVDTNALNAQTSAYGLATTDAGKTVTLGGSAEYALTVGAASSYSSTFTANICNIDTGRGKVMTINGITFPLNGILWPQMCFTLKNVNNVWTVLGLRSEWLITSAVTFNIDTSTGVDGNNDCLGALGTAGACASLANAVSQFCQVAVVIGAQVTFQTKTGQTHASQGLCKYRSAALTEGNNQPTIVGDSSSCANSANFTIDGAASAGINAVGIDTPWIIKGMKLASSSNGVSLQADNHSRIYFGTSTVFPTVSGFHMRALYDSFVEGTGNYCITGGAVVHANSQVGGKILVQPGLTVTITGTPAFTFFAQSVLNGAQEWASVTFSGSATGARISTATGGGVDTNGTPTNLPGNSAGTATSPGWSN